MLVLARRLRTIGVMVVAGFFLIFATVVVVVFAPVIGWSHFAGGLASAAVLSAFAVVLRIVDRKPQGQS